MVICNICGSNEFRVGPKARKSFRKKPRCVGCGSLERHRTLRRLYNLLKKSLPLSEMSAMQISQDHSINPQWFGSYELSIYGGENSVDIQNIERESCSYDIVICNHVLEHVKCDKTALQEMFRITSRDGFMQVSVPSPLKQEKTEDWGYPDELKYGHYRIYGGDISKLFYDAFPNSCYKNRVILADPVTGEMDAFFFLTESKIISSILKKIFKKKLSSF